MLIPQSYVVDKFFTYCKRPISVKSTGVYNAECPICHEGKSSGRKRRFFYMPEESRLFCHNCGYSGNPIKFIKDVCGLEYGEIMDEIREYDTPIKEIIQYKEPEIKKVNTETLPKDSINLFDLKQVAHYDDHRVVRDAMIFIKKRRLDTAVSKPRALWLSLTDFIHKNRVVFPFYDCGSKFDISYYQTRALYPEDEVDGRKYLSKINADKTIFNLQLVDPEIEYIFANEGPIDSMFVRNGVGLAGVYLSELQKTLISKNFPFHKVVYMFDNQWLDATALKRTYSMVQNNELVFIWPKNLNKYKDLNELCVDQKINEVPVKYLSRYIYSGLKAEMVLSEIKPGVLTPQT